MANAPAVGVRTGSIRGKSRSSLFVLATLLAAALLAIGAVPASGANAPDSLGLTARYDVRAHVYWKRGEIAVSSTAHVTNTSPNGVRGLTFNLLPLPLGRVDLGDVTVAGNPVQPNVTGQSIVVPFSGPLAPGKKVVVTISYTAQFSTSTRGKNVLFMKHRGIIAAYRWIPWLSRSQKFATPNFGETWVTGVSPQVTIRLSADRPLKFATTGHRAGTDGNAAVYTASDVRDFNFTASPHYRVKKVNHNGVAISVYYKDDSVSRLMTWTRKALDRFSQRVGPYPYGHLTVAETPAGVGMESPGLIWVDSTLAASRVPYVIVHEIAHQWFYGVVGNNQATNPFLDEAVADFLTRDLLASFRHSTCPQMPLDRSVYNYTHRCYPEVVYVQGGLYLRTYREEVGADAFWAGIRHFYRDRKFGIAGTRTLLNYLDDASGYDSQRHEKRFPSLY